MGRFVRDVGRESQGAKGFLRDRQRQKAPPCRAGRKVGADGSRVAEVPEAHRASGAERLALSGNLGASLIAYNRLYVYNQHDRPPSAFDSGESTVRILVDTLKALSDETRLRMMVLLLDNAELCVCDFVGALGLTQSKASRHLRYLYNAGLVQDRRDGLWMHYRIAPELSTQRRVIVESLGDALSREEREELRASLAGWLRQKAATHDRGNERSMCGPPGYRGQHIKEGQ